MANDYIKQYGAGHKVQRLYIHWDITTVCEHKCSYCYAMKQYEGSWMKPGPWKKQLNVIYELEKSTLPVFIGLLGGEPTSHHRYFEMLDLITDTVLHHDESRMYITTNGYKDLEFFEKHRESNGKIYFLWSWHPEYNTKSTSLEFIAKIIAMYEKGYKNKVNIMLHPKKEYWELTKFVIDTLNDLGYIDVHPHFIYKDQHSFIKYSKDFYKSFEYLKLLEHKEFIFIDKDQNKNSFSDIEIFENKVNQFKGWKCWNNNYEIGLDCQIQQFCFEDPHPISFNYFKNIKEIVPKICPFDYCSCDGLLKIKKEKV